MKEDKSFFKRLGLNEESGSVFLLAGVLLVMACVVEIFRILYFSPLPDKEIVERKKLEQIESQPQKKIDFGRNVFEELHTKYPGYKPPEMVLRQRDLGTSFHNAKMGKKDSPVTLVIYTDMNCTPCRQEVGYMLNQVKGYMDRISVIVKFYPLDQSDLQGGMFDQIAKRAGVFNGYFWRMLKKQKKLTSEDYMFTLEKSGLSLTRLRILMGEYTQDILKELQKDMDQAQALGLKRYGLPVFYLNGYRLGQNYLPQHRAVNYIEQLLAGEDLEAGKF